MFDFGEMEVFRRSTAESEDGELTDSDRDRPLSAHGTGTDKGEQESDSSPIDERNEDGLDIKPPQSNVVNLKDCGDSHERRREKHTHKHESRHHQSYDQSVRKEERAERRSKSKRRQDQDSQRSHHHRKDPPWLESRDQREERETKEQLLFIERQREHEQRERQKRNSSSERAHHRRKEVVVVEKRSRREKTRESDHEVDQRMVRSRSPNKIIKMEEKQQEVTEPEKEKLPEVDLRMHPVDSFFNEIMEQSEEEDDDYKGNGELFTTQQSSNEKEQDEEEMSGSDSSRSTSSSNNTGSKEFGEEVNAEGANEDQVADGESPEILDTLEEDLPPYLPAIQGCRSVEEFDCLNRIEEGSYGVVYRARDKRTGEIVALKRLKMENENEGFPITSLREINTLLKAQHPNIITVREIVFGSNMDRIYIVMDYVEHDLKSLMGTMKEPFLVGEVKTLMIQLLRAVAHLHDNWIIHRDLKPSNLLLSHGGILKVGDFGLAREYGSPLKPYTPVVVTQWYRAPELLLGTKEYSTPIDMWSVGCIFGELLTMKPLFPAKSEIHQIKRIFRDLGTPNDEIWPGYSELPMVKKVTFTEYPYNNLRSRFNRFLTNLGFDLLNRFLTYDPAKRITAEEALEHLFFKESPLPVDSSMFPTWPAKSEHGHRKAQSPKAPSGGKQYALQLGEADERLIAAGGFHMSIPANGEAAKGAGFKLRF